MSIRLFYYKSRRKRKSTCNDLKIFYKPCHELISERSVKPNPFDQSQQAGSHFVL